MAEVVIHPHLTTKARVQSQNSSCGQSGTGTGFSLSPLFKCQYFTNAVYSTHSFIHLSSVLHNLGNQTIGVFSSEYVYSHFHVNSVVFKGACELSGMCWQVAGAPRQVVGSRWSASIPASDPFQRTCCVDGNTWYVMWGESCFIVL